LNKSKERALEEIKIFKRFIFGRDNHYGTMKLIKSASLSLGANGSLFCISEPFTATLSMQQFI
jgi:hypothetical protein